MTIKNGHSSSDDNDVYAGIRTMTDEEIVEVNDDELVGGANTRSAAAVAAATTTSPTATPPRTSPVAAATTNAVVTANTYQIPYMELQNRGSTRVQCPYCCQQTVTTVSNVIGVGTVVAAVILALFFLPLCWLPFVLPSCKRGDHYCGHDACRKKVGETGVCA